MYIKRQRQIIWIALCIPRSVSRMCRMRLIACEPAIYLAQIGEGLLKRRRVGALDLGCGLTPLDEHERRLRHTRPHVCGEVSGFQPTWNMRGCCMGPYAAYDRAHQAQLKLWGGAMSEPLVAGPLVTQTLGAHRGV